MIHPTKVRAIEDARIKMDKIYSETSAHLLRMDLITQAFALSQDMPAIKWGPIAEVILPVGQVLLKNRIQPGDSEYEHPFRARFNSPEMIN
jgi:hypothetical protein